MKHKKFLLIALICLIGIGISFLLFSAHRPFKDLEAADITSASVRLSPPDTTIQIVETEELVSYLNEVVIYNKDNSYVTIPKDLTKVKSKVLFGLTKRQLICFGAAALIGVPLFFLLRRTASNSAAAFCMIIVMLPFFLLAMYERHGQPLEVVAGQIIRCMFLRMKERPYQTNNFYAALERQAQAEKEVKAIVQKAKAKATGTTGGKTRGKADRRRKA